MSQPKKITISRPSNKITLKLKEAPPPTVPTVPTTSTTVKSIKKIVPSTVKQGPQGPQGQGGNEFFDFNAGMEGMQANEFKQEEARDHVYNRPDMWLGSDERTPRDEWMLDITTMTPSFGSIDIPPVVVNVFREIIANSVDAINRSFRRKWKGRPNDLPLIEITMDNKTITVKNYGMPIPVLQHNDVDMLIPTNIFSNMFSSSNYEGERHEAGRNGIGAKATNIFSILFIVTIYDGLNGKYYRQVWRNNMKEAEEPEVHDIKIGTESSVEVSYVLDFARFGYDPEQGYPAEVIQLFANIALGNSFTTKQIVSFNGTVFKDYFHIKDYGRLFFGDAVDTAMIYYELKNPETEEIRNTKMSNGKMVPTPVVKKGEPNRRVVPKVECMLIDPPKDKEGVVISFASCLITNEGGCHVDAIYDAVVPAIRDKVNKVPNKKKVAGKGNGKGKGRAKPKAAPKNTPKERQHKITAKHVKPQLSMILSVYPVNPKFPNQYKTKLVAPAMKFAIPPETYKVCMKWRLIEALRNTLRAIELNGMKKTDGRKTNHINLKNVIDAANAGTKYSEDCELWIVEGKSASGYAVKLMSLMGPDARRRIGILPIRGKLLNVAKAKPARIEANREITQFKKMMGLREGVDYMIDENYKTLRYGKIVIMTDADDDGSHIKGLLLLLLFVFYRSLLERQVVFDYRTKYLSAQKGRQKINFYTSYEFYDWKEATPDWESWKFQYFKGLGTSTDEDIEDDLKDIENRFVQFIMDDKADEMFELAFGKPNANKRKEWIEDWREVKNKKYTLGTELNISMFFRYEFITYILMSLERAIPRFSDGFKRSQGQILWGAMKKWPSGKGDKYKVAQLAGYTATCVEYKHNEQCLADAIINMARDFISSNNTSLLVPLGRFGSRMLGGKDSAQPRYINTKPNWCVNHYFRKDDKPILELIQDEGQKVEPNEFYPIIPTALLNGIQGIATAYSSTVMNYNPNDLVQWIMSWLTHGPLQGMARGGDIQDVDPIILVPWYRGFTGEIALITGEPIADSKTEGDDDIEDEEVIHERLDGDLEEALKGDDPEGEADDNSDDDDDDDDDDQEKKLKPKARLFGSDIVQEGRAAIVEEVAPRKKKVVYDRVEIRGTFRIEKTKVIVDELPIGRWFVNYAEFLEHLRTEKELTNYVDLSSDSRACFEITGLKGKPTLNKLNLRRRFRLSNMVFLDSDKIPKRFDNVEQYMEEFCLFRLGKYEERKALEVEKRKKAINDLDDRIRFILAVVEERIIVMNRTKKDVKEDMKKEGIPPEIFDAVKLYETTRDQLEKLQADQHELIADLEKYESISPAYIWYKELKGLQKALSKHKDLKRTSPPLVLRPGQKFPNEEAEEEAKWRKKNTYNIHLIVADEPGTEKKPVIKKVPVDRSAGRTRAPIITKKKASVERSQAGSRPVKIIKKLNQSDSSVAGSSTGAELEMS